ncbi:MAG: aminopeptidase P N-terminal domain-containing protein [Persicimonas sp.]
MNPFNPERLAARRRELMERIGEGGVAILVANSEQTRSHDTDFPYRPSSDIMYLTGFEEPKSVVVLAPGHEEGEFVMFVRDRDSKKEQWDGRRAGPDGAVAEYGADAAFCIDEIDEKLPQFLEERERLYYTLGKHRAFDRRLTRWMNDLRHRRNQPSGAPAALLDLRDELHEMRLFKDDDEMEAMRRAARVTAEAHIEAMKRCRPGVHEYELQAALEAHFREHGANFPAYSSIVGSGDNATILHYIANRDVIDDGEVVLIDAGAELDYYAADITRSFPASGSFEPAQRDLYEAVLDTQLAVIDLIEPGLAYGELQKLAARRLTEAMVELDLLSGSIDELVEEEDYKAYYPHNIGHWLGIDVHDVGSYYDDEGEYRPLEPRMVLTIEPGIYVPADDEEAPEALRGVGVRIEDDILVTEEGHENLTSTCPKAIDEIEALVGSEAE